jgi:hypothetical protein
MWRHNNKIKREETFDKILEAIAFVYKTLDGENIDSLQEALNGPDVELGFDIDSVGGDEDNEIDSEIEEDLFAFFDINNDSVRSQSHSSQSVRSQSVSSQSVSSQSRTAGSVIQIDALIENSVENLVENAVNNVDGRIGFEYI